MEEIFFKAYFTEGRDLNNIITLIELALQAGLNLEEVQDVAQNEGLYLKEVNADIDEAREIGIQGVPFFVFDRKYAISGAQPVETFVQTIKEILNNS